MSFLVHRLFRISWLIRLAWIAVAALHAWLIGKRLIQGDLGLLISFKITLCIAAIWYATLKVWQVSTVFDSAPRRVLGFALLLVLGHWLIATPQDRRSYADNASNIALTTVAVLPVLEVLLLGFVAVALVRRLAAARSVAFSEAEPQFLFDLHPWIVPLCGSPPSLFRRPPPLA